MLEYAGIWPAHELDERPVWPECQEQGGERSERCLGWKGRQGPVPGGLDRSHWEPWASFQMQQIVFEDL